MDWAQIIKELGGGPAALSLAALAYAYWSERREHRVTMHKRIAEHQQHAEAMLQITREAVGGLGSATAAINELTREVKRDA